MSLVSGDPLFAGRIPVIYDRYLVPLIFETHADDIARRVASVGPWSVLELAAGTGVVTRRLARNLGADVALTATDLNQPMVDHAATRGADHPVTWLAADALSLPFDDGSFDVVVCQFGVMFFPDRIKAYAEARRVLRPGGRLIFNVWDRIETNELALAVSDGLATVFPDDPPDFLARTPHGYFDEGQISSDLKAGGFGAPEAFDRLDARSLAATPAVPAIAYCQGTPLRNEIEQREPTSLAEATDAAAACVRDRFGERDIDGRVSGFVVSVCR